MPALLIYLLKVNIALLIFCLGYYTVLRRLTFYTLNRVYLILAIVFCSLYPAINFTGVVQKHQQLAKPLQVIIIDLGTRAQNISKPIMQTDYWQWVIILFWLGVGLMTIRLIIQFFSLYNLYRRSKPGMVNQQQVRLMNHNSNPFSFWQHIYINPELHSKAELSSIIAHEQVHVKQWHTLDILLAELSLIFYWFNPGVWMMKKAISENLEFITDRKILQQGTDAKSYQYSLLYTCVNTTSNAMVNHFNISTIKKRIMMMNSKKSATYNITRYTFIVPTVLLLLLAFGTSKAALVDKGVNAVKKVGRQAITMINLVTTNAKADTNKKNTVSTNNAELTKIKKDIDTAKTKPDVPVLLKLKQTGLIDSLDYYIDGKLANADKYKSLNADDILSTDVLEPKANGKATIAVITKNNPNIALVKEMQATQEQRKKAVMIKVIDATVPINGNGNITYADKPITVDIKGKGDEKFTQMKSDFFVVNTDTSMRFRPDTKKFYNSNFNYSPLAPVEAGISNGINMTINPNRGVYPLIMIDNKEVSKEEFQAYPSNKIDHVMILKDGDATKLYGDKAKEGVVLITSKDAKKQ
ncbi:M56 family metallopeptidase [Mucilaginibacter jinjuensis]|uniref:M56 family metallopeptidase n=1 Tax=Mucilaginibacter jinjuensis TaxID=1176721 RepID=A0ABY7T3M8_9SPHI|nr:M56 family metallopeptidase [Mucilaginibacter jinjuensis]WCT10795.1 M56 family metallopeptidase [Mucilaginibacter jinjuensis]